MKKQFSCSKGLLIVASRAALFAAGVPAALAQHAAVEAPNVALLSTYVETDDVRGVDEGDGLQLAMAWGLTETLHLQLHTSYVNFDTDIPATDFYRTAASLELVRYFNPAGFAPFIVGGIGAAHNDVAISAHDRTGFTAAAGLGLLSRPFTDYGVRARAEARYVYDRFQGDPRDIHFSLGLVFPLRKPRTVEVVRTEVKEVLREVVREVAPPTRDNDKDGVPDQRDECSDTLPGAAVDVRGCVPVKAVIQLPGVHFEHDSSRLTENSRSILAMAVASLRGQRDMRVEVAGHTDNRGDDGYNLELSRRRALAVVEFLSSAGIGRERLEARGYGESLQLDSNDTDTGRERNRRVEFRVLPN